MTITGMIPCAGLATDPNPLISGAQGGLRKAEDVVIERPGVATQRPSFTAHGNKMPTDRRPRSMIVGFGGSAPLVSSYDGASTYRIESMTGIIGGEATPIDPNRSWVQFADARRNVYFTTTAGLRKLTSAVDTQDEAAGLHEPGSGSVAASATGTPSVFPTDRAWAYRWCFVRIDANGTIVRTAPSPWQSASNTSGATRDGFVHVSLPSYVVAGDTLEIYRTIAVQPATATPSDEMYLVQRHVITSGDVTNTYVEITDRTAEAKLGALLYTSGTRDGILKANGRAPACGALALYSDCLWFGRTIGPWTGVVDILAAGGAGVANAINYHDLVGDSSAGSPTLINFASTTLVRVGMLVTDGGLPGTTTGTIPIGAKVVSKTATTVTLDANATATAVGATFTVRDGVTVGTVTWWAANVDYGGAGRGAAYPYFSVQAGTALGAARSLAAAITEASSLHYAFAIEDPSGDRDAYGKVRVASVVVRAVSLSAAIFTFTSTHLTAGVLDWQSNAAGTILVQRDDRPNRVYYSKPGEPEHVPELNWLEIGSEIHPVIALAPLRASLLVLKTDGIYRITGSPPDNWRVDLVERDHVLIRGEAVDVLEGVAYAWTQRGVVAVDEAGARSVTEGLIGREMGTHTERAFVSLARGCFVRAWPDRQLVLVGVPTDVGGQYANVVYAHHVVTRAWTKWTTLPLYCAAGAPGYFFVARGGAYWDVRQARTLYGTFTGYDVSFSISTWTASGTLVTIATADLGLWVPKAGDRISAVISGTTIWRRVTQVVINGANHELTIASAFPAGAQTSRTGYEGILSAVQWQAQPPGAGALGALVREIQVSLDWSAYPSGGAGIGEPDGRMTIGCATSDKLTVVSQTATRAITPMTSIQVRATAGLEVGRAQHYYPEWTTDDVGLAWRLLGCELVLEPTSERGRR